MRTTKRTCAAAGAVALGLAALGGGVAEAAPPDPDAVVPLIGVEVDPFGVGALVTDDAVYVVHAGSDAAAELYRRALTPQGEGTAVGPLQLVARTAPFTAVAEHAGTLAYLRAVDGRLVLRAPDGTESMPAWGATAALAAGPQVLTGRWVVPVTSTYDETALVLDRATGHAYDLAALITAPELAGGVVRGLDVTDDRAVVTIVRTTAGIATSGVVTVPLGPSGPSGPAEVLDEVTWDTSSGPGHMLVGVGVEGDLVVWEDDATAGTATTLRWVNTATDVTGELADAGTALDLEGSTVVTATPVGGGLRYDWRDLAGDPTVPLPSLTVDGSSADSHGSLVALIGIADGELTGSTTLVDASGRALVAPQGAGSLAGWPFSDVAPEDPFVGELLWLADHGVVRGYADGSFRALATVNRDAMAAFLYRATHTEGQAAPCTQAPFTDVAVTHPFCSEIAWLKTTGVAQGWPDGTFQPSTPISREAMAAFLYRLAQGSDAAAPACGSAAFADVPASSAFCGEISWLATHGISTGWSDGTFRPGAPIERQAMGAFLFRALDGGLI